MAQLKELSPLSSQRLLDVACGTGILLRQVHEQFAGVRLYGVDASADMLEQARQTLSTYPAISLKQAEVGPADRANLPYEVAFFDVITCANVLHALPDPEKTLRGLWGLLTPGGTLVLEDYARRTAPFPWWLFEPLLKRIEGVYVRAYTRAEAERFCTQLGFELEESHSFIVNRLWHGWVIRARKKDA